MPEQSLLTRTLKLGSTGKDVEAAKRTVYRFLKNGKLKTLATKPAGVRRTFGPFFLLDVYAARKQAGFARKPLVDEAFWQHMVKKGAPDVLAIDLMNAYRDALPPPKPKLVEPNQGWGSLHESLWEAYSEGRRRNFTDLGTYVNKPGDHGVGPPCYAFDLGREDRFLFKGWGYLAARRLALYYVKHHERLNIEYVILGRQLWSRERPYWHPLTTGDTSHDFHLHVSGVR